MKHLYNFSYYQPLTDIPGSSPDVNERLESMGCDGLELFTLFEEVPAEYRGVSPGVHLPFAIDWYRAWSGGLRDEECGADGMEYATFGRDREEMVGNVRKAIAYAAEADPAYGVLHAGNTDLDDVMHRKHRTDDRKVLKAFAEFVNQVVSGFRGGEPPFRLAFENLWWSGLKLTGEWEFRLLEEELEFDNWGFCLDTGHMMNTLDSARDEASAIDGLLRIFEGYSDDMKDRIGTVHFHLSTSADYRSSFIEEDRPESETVQETIARSYPHVMKIDQHRPFSDPRCVLLIDALHPDFVTHEMIGSGSGDPITDFRQQRSYFR